MEPEEGSEKAPKVPDSVIRAALLRRAVEDIHRIIQIRTAKQACSSLLQRGSVGDDLWQRFQRAEKEMEEELRDVVMEVCLHRWRGNNYYHLPSHTWTNHIPLHRRTVSYQAGVKSFSNPPMRLPQIKFCATGSRRSRNRQSAKRSGGRSVGPARRMSL